MRVATLLGTPAKRTLAPFRLRRHADYQRVYKAGRKWHSSSMSYFFRLRSPEETPRVEGPRIGITVGKVMGKAVDRNRLKRRMREAVRLHLSILCEGPEAHIDLVLHPRKSVATMEFTALEHELSKVFAQVAANPRQETPAPQSRERARPPARNGALIRSQTGPAHPLASTKLGARS